MSIYMFTNENEILCHPFVAESKEKAQEKMQLVLDKRKLAIKDNIARLKDAIKSCKRGIKEYTEDKSAGNITDEDVNGFDFIEFQNGLIDENKAKLKEQELILKTVSIDVKELDCYLISEKV